MASDALPGARPADPAGPAAVPRLAGGSRWRAALPGLAIAIAVAAAFAPSLGGGFVFDDHALVGDRPLLRGPLWRIWLSTDAADYWPLTSSTFWLEWRLWGASPLGYRLVNLALHAAVAVLLWRALRRLSAPGAWAAALLFAVHPVTVESAAWISERKNVLSGVFFLGSALAWLRFRDNGAAGAARGSAALFAAALLAKTSTVMLPVLLLGEVMVRGWRRPAAERRWLGVLFGLAGILGAVTLWFQWTRSMGGLTLERTLTERLLGAGWAWLTYLWTAFQPFAAAVVYAPRPLPAASALTWAPLAAFAAAAAALHRYWNAGARLPALALGHHALMLLPVLGLLDMSFLLFSPAGNHLQYLALMGPAALAGAAVGRLASGRPRAAAVLAAGLATLLGVHTAARSAAYRDDVSLWSRAVREAPQSLTAARFLAGALADAGRPADAFAALEAAARRLDDRPSSLRAEALRLSQLGRGEEAVERERAASRLREDLGFRYELAVILSRGGRADLAAPLLAEVVARQPRSAASRYQLASALARTGRLGEATEQAHAGCALRAGSPSCTALALLLARQGRPAEARQALADAMREPPWSAAVERVLREAFPGGLP